MVAQLAPVLHDGAARVTSVEEVVVRVPDLFPDPPADGVVHDPGLFGPGSAAWRVGRERALLLGGPAALLLQVAHPLVAAGVAEHSAFGADPLRRLRGTLDAVLTVTFGDSAQARAAAARVGRAHRPVRGTLPVGVGATQAGTPYRAQDPELALWVLTTLEWAAVRSTELFVRPVAPAELEAYHRDMGRLGRLFGVTPAVLPEGWSGVRQLIERTTAETLAVDATARRLAHAVLDPVPPILPRPVRRLPALVAAGMLPASVRDAYGLPWRRRERLAFAAFRHVVRGGLPLLPRRVRRWPHADVARRRVAGRHGP